MRKLSLCLIILSVVFSRSSGQSQSREQGSSNGRTIGSELSDRITRLEGQLDALKPLPGQVSELRLQLVELQGKLDNLNTKLNVVMGILVAIALPVLGEIVKRVSERLTPPLPPMQIPDSRTMDIFEKVLREKLAGPPSASPPAATGEGTKSSATGA